METSLPPFRFGLSGVLHPHAVGIVRQIANHPDEFQLAGVFEPDPLLAAARQREWSSLIPDLKWCASEEELLNLTLDGMVIEGAVHLNVPHAQRVIDLGIPVLLEKPAGIDLIQFEKLQHSARQRGVHLQMLYLFRYMSAMSEIRRLATEGHYGHIYMFRGRLPKDLTLYDSHVEELGMYRGGIFFEMAGHLVDLMITLMGVPEKVTPFLGHHHPEKGGEFIDNGVALFQFAKAWGMIEVPALELAPDARRIEVFGMKGAAVIPHLGSGHLANHPFQPLEVFHENDKAWKTLNLPAATLQITDLREFVAVVRQQKSPEFSMDHDLAVHKALLEASGMVAS